MRRIIWISALFAVTQGIGGTVRADLLGYVATNTSNSVVYLTNFDTGEQTPLGPSGVTEIRALEYAGGVLYAGAGTGGTKVLWQVDTTTGLGTVIGNTAQLIHNLAATPDGRLYGSGHIWETERLLLFDTETAEASVVGSLAPYTAMAAFAIDHNGLAIGWDSGSNWLFRINLSDASTTPLGHLPGRFNAFDFAPDGTLYAWNAAYDLYEIDLATAESTFLGNYPDAACFSLAFAVEPGPLPIRMRKGVRNRFSWIWAFLVGGS